MSRFREKFEVFFISWAKWTFDKKWTALVLSFGLLCLTALPMGKIRFESSSESLFHKDDPARINYEKFKERFGKDDMFIIALESERIFDVDFLRMLSELHAKLKQEVPYVADITSLVNVRHTRGEADRLVVEDLMKSIPKTSKELAAFKKRVKENPLYRNYLISEDARITTIIIEPKTIVMKDSNHFSQINGNAKATTVDTAEYIQMFEKIRSLTKPYRDKGVKFHYTGHPVLMSVLDKTIKLDLAWLTPLSLVFVVFFLAILFRKLTGVVYPFIIVFASLVSTLGSMALFDLPLTNITSCMPTFLVVVGVADSVHILAIFYRRYRYSGDKQASIVGAFAHSGLPVLLTSITTAAGLLSFASADVAWVADLGLAAPLGVAYAFLYTMLFLPALISIFPVRRSLKPHRKHQFTMDKLLAKIGSLGFERSRWIIVVWAAVLVVALIGLSRLRLSQNGLKWFPEGHPIRTATETIDRAMKGSLSLEIVIDTGKENGLYNAKLMQQLEQSIKTFEGYQDGPVEFGKAMSVTSVLKEVNKALHENRSESYVVPDNDQLVAQELLLFEMSGSDDLEDLISTDFRMLRVTITKPFLDAVLYIKAFQDVEDHLKENYPKLEISMTGMTVLFIETVYNILHSMAKSYPVALLIISLLMFFMLGRIRLGLLSMVPNLIPILIITGCMGWLDIPFDFSTMLIGSMAIGLVVDDTIHFLHTFNAEFSRSVNRREAVRKTMVTTGLAIFTTSITLAAGFFIYLTATLQNLVYFGLLIGSTILLAMLADFLLVPALIAVFIHDEKNETVSAK